MYVIFYIQLIYTKIFWYFCMRIVYHYFAHYLVTAGVIVPLMNSQVVQLTVNHPFLIYIRDQRTGFIFMGQVNDPSQKT